MTPRTWCSRMSQHHQRPALELDRAIPLRAASAGRLTAHLGNDVNAQIIGSGDSQGLKLSAPWNGRAAPSPALPGCVSFETRDACVHPAASCAIVLHLDGDDRSNLFASMSDAFFSRRVGTR
ncbi:hypothetical protein C8R47DRAFT_1091413 [Mycena vitilis]|nr:hypothetical protein C8R47DRAFT_1091413 [Mycena vitilis]